MAENQKHTLASLTRDIVPYASHYCEENVYKLIEQMYATLESQILDEISIFAVMISNESKRTPIWMQKLENSTGKDEPVIWDYHVVVLVTSNDPTKQLIFDCDSVLPYPCPSTKYIIKSFRPHMPIRPEFRQLFRVIPGREYLAKFSSDRTHMESSGMAPPTWPIICGEQANSAMELPVLWTVTNADKDSTTAETVGKVMNGEDLLIVARTGALWPTP